MTKASIHPGASIGAVHLRVPDLARSIAFYEERLGFRKRADGEGGARTEERVARLGAGGPDLLVLHERPRARPAPGTAGLYHFAVLVPSRRALAAALKHLLATHTPLRGASDHLVSEALYLDDPDDNGIEIYRDRPRGEWRVENGQVRMANDPLDLRELLAELDAGNRNEDGLLPGTKIGHMHLRVSDLESAERFYVDVLGFEHTAHLGDSAVFLAAGGYHHHIGLNTWAGVGAPPPPPDAAGLGHFVIRLPDRTERDRVVERARAAGVAVEDSVDGPALRDPSSHRIVLTAGPQA